MRTNQWSSHQVGKWNDGDTDHDQKWAQVSCDDFNFNWTGFHLIDRRLIFVVNSMRDTDYLHHRICKIWSPSIGSARASAFMLTVSLGILSSVTPKASKKTADGLWQTSFFSVNKMKTIPAVISNDFAIRFTWKGLVLTSYCWFVDINEVKLFGQVQFPAHNTANATFLEVATRFFDRYVWPGVRRTVDNAE